MFSIYDGRSEFYQWDIDRKIIVNDKTINQVHFCNRTDDCRLVCEVYELDGLRVADVPNILLQNDWRINVYGYDVNYTKHSQCFKVKTRTKPASYAYTETEIKTWERVEAQTGYYVPAIDEEGNLSWQASKDTLPEALGANIRGPKGEDGKDGKDGKNIDDSVIGSDGWSSKKIIDTLAPVFTVAESPVAVCKPVENYPLNVVSRIDVKQAGTGTPSPDNIRPIEAQSEVKLTQCGKNLFDISKIKTTTIMESQYSSMAEIAEVGENYIALKTYPGYAGNGFTVTNVKFREVCPSVRVGDTITVNATTDAAQKIFYLSPSATVIRLGVAFEVTEAMLDSILSIYGLDNLNSKQGTGVCITKNIQVEFGNTATAYEPYREPNTFTFDLGQSIYGGTLDWATGTLTCDWVCEELGNPSYMISSGVAVFPPKNQIAYSSTITNWHSSHYQGGNWHSGYPDNFMYAANENNIVIRDDTHFNGTGATNTRAYLAAQKAAGTPIMISYKLKTPVVVGQLTPQHITALAGVNTLYSDTGNTAVSGRADLTAIIAELQQAIISLGGNV